LDLLVSDADELENAEFDLHIEDVANSDRVFGVFPTRARGRAAVQVLVLNSDALDFEDAGKREFSFRIVVTPVRHRKSSDAPHVVIRIRLSDVNDNDPVFAQDSFVLEVSEDVPAGHLVSTIEARDEHSGEFGRVRYSLQVRGVRTPSRLVIET
jgi:hypothetical protein